jgi:acyl-CoA reductase-like NAD-dependent aldehyde dehydrogenase
VLGAPAAGVGGVHPDDRDTLSLTITQYVASSCQPLGVVVAIVPREAPVLAAATKLFAALPMGCPVLLKTAPQAPFSAYLLAQALSDAGYGRGSPRSCRGDAT